MCNQFAQEMGGGRSTPVGRYCSNWQKHKYCYRHKIRKRQASGKSHIPGSLHTALSKKKQGAFWKMWCSKFGLTKFLPSKINGKSCKLKIANEFSVYAIIWAN